MAEPDSQSESESSSSLGPILDLLLSVGYAEAPKTDVSAVNDVVRDGTLTRREEMHVTLSDMIAINALNNFRI